MRLSLRPGLECPPHERIYHVWNWQEQFDNDIWYVENISFRTDCLMFIRLVQFVFDRKNAETRANAKKGTFMGYDFDGNTIKVDDIPDEYIERAFREIPKEKKSYEENTFIGRFALSAPRY